MTTCPPALVPWHQGPMIGFDLETTGVNVESDRIVTAAIVHIEPGKRPHTAAWLANPGIPIPEQATAVHGISTAVAAAQGANPHAVLLELVRCLATAVDDGTPIVGMNLVYDLTLLERECRRHQVGFPDRIEPVIDVRVLDKAVDPYRKGGRKLADLCAVYNVRLDAAHDAGGDALGSLRVAYAMAARNVTLQIDPLELHRRQIRWAAEQTASFAAYRRKQGQPLDDEDGTWPVRPAKQPTGATV